MSIKKQIVDICFLQETYSMQETYSRACVENIWRNEWGGRIVWSHGANYARGVAIVIKNGIDIQIEQEHSDDSGRLLLKAIIQGEPYVLINLYAPNAEEHQVHFYRFFENFYAKQGRTGWENNNRRIFQPFNEPDAG